MNRILILLLLGSTAYAQRPEKGVWLVGADVANLTVLLPKATQNRVLSGNVALLGGRFVSNQVVLGASLPVEWISAPMVGANTRFNSTVYGLVPFARLYLSNSRLSPYLSVGAGYVTSRFKAGSAEASNSGATYNGGVGLAYFLTKNVSFDLAATYVSQPYRAATSVLQERDNRINASLRFQIFLGK